MRWEDFGSKDKALEAAGLGVGDVGGAGAGQNESREQESHGAILPATG